VNNDRSFRTCPPLVLILTFYFLSNFRLPYAPRPVFICHYRTPTSFPSRTTPFTGIPPPPAPRSEDNGASFQSLFPLPSGPIRETSGERRAVLPSTSPQVPFLAHTPCAFVVFRESSFASFSGKLAATFLLQGPFSVIFCSGVPSPPSSPPLLRPLLCLCL